MPQRRKHIRLNDLVQMRMLKNVNNVKNVGIMLENRGICWNNVKIWE